MCSFRYWQRHIITRSTRFLLSNKHRRLLLEIGARGKCLGAPTSSLILVTITDNVTGVSPVAYQKICGFCSSILHTSLPWFRKPQNSGNSLIRRVCFLGSEKASKIIMMVLVTKLMKLGGGMSSSRFCNNCNCRMKNTMFDQDAIRKVGGGGGSPSISGKHRVLVNSNFCRKPLLEWN